MAEGRVLTELIQQICALATPEQVLPSDPKVAERNKLLAALGETLAERIGKKTRVVKGFGTHYGELAPWVGLVDARAKTAYGASNLAIVFAAEGDCVRVALQGPLASGPKFLDRTRDARDRVRAWLLGRVVSGSPTRDGEFATGDYKTNGPRRSAARSSVWFEHPADELPDDETLLAELRALLALLNEMPEELRTLPQSEAGAAERAESLTGCVLLAINPTPNGDGLKITDAAWRAVCGQIAAGSEVRDVWRCHVGVKGGERFLMVQMGENPGIVGAGRIVSATQLQRGVREADVSFTHAFPAPPPGLTKADLQAGVPQKNGWKLQRSGISVADDVADWIWSRLPAPTAAGGVVAAGPSQSSASVPQLLRPHPANLLLEGVPGTGKTWSVRQVAADLQAGGHEVRGSGTGRFAITLHPATTYEDFVEGLRPGTGSSRVDRAKSWVADGGRAPGVEGRQAEGEPWFWKDPVGAHGGSFSVHDGFFLRVCAEAVHFPFQEFVVLLDEFNRCNVPKVMGDLLTCVEPSKRVKRDASGAWCLNDADGVVVTLPTSGRLFFVPENITIVATMNSSDRSVGSLDAALRRRFASRRVSPLGFTENTPEGDVETVVARAGVSGMNPASAGHFRATVEGWNTLTAALGKHLGPDAMLGHSYLFDLAAALRGSPRFAIAGEDAVTTCRRYWDDAMLPQLCEALDAVHGARLLDADCPERWLQDAFTRANTLFLGAFVIVPVPSPRDVPVRRALVRTRWSDAAELSLAPGT